MTTGGTHARKGHAIRDALIVCASLGALVAGTVVTLASQGSTAVTAPKFHPQPGAHATASAPQGKPALKAEIIARRMRLRGVKAYTARTDVNRLLGRQHEYTSKINWGPALGSSIEVFGSVADAQARLSYLSGFSCPLGDGYDYASGSVLLRVSCSFTPGHARRLAARFNAIVGS